MSENTIYLLLGGNIPDRAAWLQKGVHAIASTCGVINQSSAIYETAAWGKEDQGAFLNLALQVTTRLSPPALLNAIHKIENSLGRLRQEQWGSRTLDIDILFYGAEIIDLPDLKIPHPFLHLRRFALVPLAEIAPGLLHPRLGETVQDLLKNCPDKLPVSVYQTGGNAF